MAVTFTYQAQVFSERFNWDRTQVTRSYDISTVDLSVPDGETSFTIGGDGMLDSLIITDHRLTYAGQSVLLTAQQPVQVSHLMHGAGLETDILLFGIHVFDGNDQLIGIDEIYIYLDGDALPEFTDIGVFMDWKDATTGWSDAPASGAYAAGQTANWGDFDLPNGIYGTSASERLEGTSGADTINGGDGADTIIGGDGDDLLIGGESANDLRDVIYGGNGNDSISGGYGNDELNAGSGNDTVGGGFGADTIYGFDGNDVLTGEAWSDLIYGGNGSDFINGGFGHDRMNGGAGADRFYHLGVVDHGSDWIQDYTAADGDLLVFGGMGASADDFLVHFAETPNAGVAGVDEAFVTYVPTGRVLWALIDGGGEDVLNISIGGQVVDLFS